jgi:hypothetical protein
METAALSFDAAAFGRVGYTGGAKVSVLEEPVLEEPVLPLEPAGGLVGCQVPPLAFNVVSSVTCFAVEVLPETTAATRTVSPVLTLPMPISPPFTLVPESTVKVPEVPSALFTVRDQVLPEVSVTSETVPVRSDRVSYPLGPLTVNWP